MSQPLVLALGASFAVPGQTVSDLYGGNRLRRYLNEDYRGGFSGRWRSPISILPLPGLKQQE